MSQSTIFDLDSRIRYAFCRLSLNFPTPAPPYKPNQVQAKIERVCNMSSSGIALLSILAFYRVSKNCNT